MQRWAACSDATSQLVRELEGTPPHPAPQTKYSDEVIRGGSSVEGNVDNQTWGKCDAGESAALSAGISRAERDQI